MSEDIGLEAATTLLEASREILRLREQLAAKDAELARLSTILSRRTEWDDAAVSRRWRLDLSCCGFANGSAYYSSWEKAEAVREAYVTGVGVAPHGYSDDRSRGHQRSAVITAVTTHQDDELSRNRNPTPESIAAAIRARQGGEG